MSSLRPRIVAVGTALVGTISIWTAALVFAPEDPLTMHFTDGISVTAAEFNAGLGVFALVEAGVLFVATRRWNASERTRRLLTGGAVAGSLSIVLLVVPAFASLVFDVLVPTSRLGFTVGFLLVPVGVGCTGLGVVFQLLEGSRTETRT